MKNLMHSHDFGLRPPCLRRVVGLPPTMQDSFTLTTIAGGMCSWSL